MAITRTAMVDDDGSGTTGTIINNAWKTELYNQIDAADAAAGGVWVPVAYNAADFTAAGGGTWTVPAAAVMMNRYVLIGKLMHWRIYLNHFGGAMSLTGTVTALQIKAPAGATLSDWQTHTIGQLVEGGGAPGDAYVVTSGTLVQVTRRDGANWTAAPVYVVFHLALEIT